MLGNVLGHVLGHEHVEVTGCAPETSGVSCLARQVARLLCWATAGPCPSSTASVGGRNAVEELES